MCFLHVGPSVVRATLNVPLEVDRLAGRINNGRSI